MLVFGALLACLDPVLTIAAAMAHGRPLFMSPRPEEREEVDARRTALLCEALAARSDHVAMVAAFNGWAAAQAQGACSGLRWGEVVLAGQRHRRRVRAAG